MGVEQALPHIPRLRRYARLLTGSRERADDLVQDTLERACRKWSLWRPQSSVARVVNAESSGLRGWLLSMMHNVHINHVRTEMLEEAFDDELDAATGLASGDTSQQSATRLDIEAALAQLSPTLREVVLLVCVEECSYAEAARIAGVPVGTVMSRLSRGREKLRELMSSDTASENALRPNLRVIKTAQAVNEN
jgi:RNA polymerase sigma-70 factor (ECF subfamily)